MSLERVLVHTSLFPSPLSVTVSRFHRSAPARTSLAEFWLLLFPPCHLALGTVGSPASYCFESGGFGTCKSQLQTPALYPLASGGGARCLPQRGWEGKLTFSAKTGLPESSVRCKNSKCRDPNSARMLLLPAVAQPQLPLKRHQLLAQLCTAEKHHPAGSCGTGCACCAPGTSANPSGPHCVDVTEAGEEMGPGEGGLSPCHSLCSYQATFIIFGML